MYHDSTKLPTSYHDTPNGEPINLYAYTLQVKIIQLKTKRQKEAKSKQRKGTDDLTFPCTALPGLSDFRSPLHHIRNIRK